MSNFDQSHLDSRYFVDTHKYNCPFCKRRHVVYNVVQKRLFDWSNERIVYIYIARCGSCGKESMHLSDYDLEIFSNRFYKVKSDKNEDLYIETLIEEDKIKLDDLFFYKQPTSFFTLDSRINKKIRELLSEAHGSKDSGFMVGASGVLRKAIYEFLKLEKAQGASYEEKIKYLKTKYPNISAALFDALSNIQDMTSANLHEGMGWQSFTSDEFIYFTEIFEGILDSLYVKPDEEKKRLDKITDLKKNLSRKQTESNNEQTTSV